MTIGIPTFLLLPYILVPLLIWSMTWKGLALWAAGKRREKAWFICVVSDKHNRNTGDNLFADQKTKGSA